MDVVIGLGSNLGDRIGHLRAASAALQGPCELVARSAIYETAPVGPPQPDYLNAAVRVSTPMTPEQLLETLLAVERREGRVRSVESRWGPRTLDLDVLWIDGLVLATPTLTVPHPHLVERPFALLPMRDVAPEAIDPRTKARFAFPADDPGARRTTFSW